MPCGGETNDRSPSIEVTKLEALRLATIIRPFFYLFFGLFGQPRGCFKGKQKDRIFDLRIRPMRSRAARKQQRGCCREVEMSKTPQAGAKLSGSLRRCHGQMNGVTTSTRSPLALSDLLPDPENADSARQSIPFFKQSKKTTSPLLGAANPSYFLTPWSPSTELAGMLGTSRAT